MLRRNIADSFVNLGRRNQNLLDRQLDFITDLEHEETDPDALEACSGSTTWPPACAATPSRCCALAGGGAATASWAGPFADVDVVRGALGEVEDYQRVDIARLDAATVRGRPAPTWPTPLAELLENALAFSPAGPAGRGPRPPPPTRRLRAGRRSTTASAWRPRSWPRPTGASPARSPSPWPRPGTWATTWPATWPPPRRAGRAPERPPAAGGTTARIDIPARLLHRTTLAAAPPPPPPGPAPGLEPEAVGAPWPSLPPATAGHSSLADPITPARTSCGGCGTSILSICSSVTPRSRR